MDTSIKRLHLLRSMYAMQVSTRFGKALMWASPMDVVDLNGDVHSRGVFFVADEPTESCIFGHALMCASAMLVLER